MQMHESKTNASTRSGSSAQSNPKVSNNTFSNNRVTSSANNDNNNNAAEQTKKAKKKSIRDKQLASSDDAKPASVMSNLSSYSLIEDDHIDDQETINVGNLIIDLESDLEKEKIENEQLNNNSKESNIKPPLNSSNTTNAPTSTSTASSVTSKSNIKSSLNSSTDTKSNSIKQGQKSNNNSSKHPSSSSGSANNSINATNNNGHASPRTIFKSLADERGELKMKITRETKIAKHDHKMSATQKSSTTSADIIGGTSNRATRDNDGADNSQSIQSSSISSTKECGTSTSIGTITEPDCLGPCEPGTSVTLEGIVWQETDGGILVVNVTWRGKTYVGALLDCTRHDWAPPRLCDSPASDIDLKTSKGVRAKRIVTRSNGNNSLDEKNLLQTTGKLRNGKGRRLPTTSEPVPSCSKKQRDTSSESAQAETNNSQTNTSSVNSSETLAPAVTADNTNPQQDSVSPNNPLIDKAGPESPMLISCTEPNCSKKYRNLNGLLYHQAHAHGSENDSSNNNDDNCSSSTKDNTVDNAAAKDEFVQENQIADSDQNNRLSPNLTPSKEGQQIEDSQHGQKRQRTPSPQPASKLNKLANPILHPSIDLAVGQMSDPSNSPFMKRLDTERRHSNSSSHNMSTVRSLEPGHRSPGAPQPGRSTDFQHSSLSSAAHHSTSKMNRSSPKQNNQPIPQISAPSEEGMKPSGTSTGPPPAPHQGNCYFNHAFLANTFSPYALPPYFPRSMYDPMATPTSNAAFLTRFMSNMPRAPPPPSDSPSRLLSPSMPKNIPYPPFKVDPSLPPPQIPVSLGGHPMPNLPPHMSAPQHPHPPPPPNQLPPIPQGPPPHPPPQLGSGSPSLRMPSQGDPMLPPSSQPPFLPPTSLASVFGIPGLPNPLGPIGVPPMPNLVDDALAKQFPRRFN